MHVPGADQMGSRALNLIRLRFRSFCWSLIRQKLGVIFISQA